MSTHTLVHQAVRNTTTTGRKALGDKLFARWFSQLVYAQIWEDPQIDIEALALKPGARLVTIASGGCNALAYLSQQPAVVHAVDLNHSHLAMLALKKAAFATLPDYQTLLDFLGSADRKQNPQRFRRYVAPQLPVVARQYWEGKDWRGRQRYQLFAHHAYRHGLLGRFIGFGHLVTRLLGGNLGKIADAGSLDEQRALFDRHLEPVFRHPLLRFLARRESLLYSMGIPPAQFAALREDAGGDLATLFSQRMRRLACDFPLAANPFAQQAFARRYDIGQQEALPMYLQSRHYESIRHNLTRLLGHHGSMTDFLDGCAPQSLDAYLLLDAQDWMDDAQLNALWRQITRTAAPGARVVFRTGGSRSPLEGRLAPQLMACWHTDPDYNRSLHARDRAAIYGGVHLYCKRT
ncbi:DUF3419 family protein [Vogesella sp. LIG4]|uniref:DUF3419 family protein n=1 Tax=Vogesella sp. LIG4 TaxID=1192162 RepID=UPI00081F9678|nr:DUF3419 family protein [Vogesella sp. LIG4]SCK22302.1 S-adenosylmethionine-diacylglycerol 3-amino-3-carboxypropyl transferase [Vogesella sp. LIG4]